MAKRSDPLIEVEDTFYFVVMLAEYQQIESLSMHVYDKILPVPNLRWRVKYHSLA